MSRTPLPHPDASRVTLRMPFAQLRALVVSASEPGDEVDQAVAEFEARPTTYRATRPPRATTLDDVIASLLRG